MSKDKEKWPIYVSLALSFIVLAVSLLGERALTLILWLLALLLSGLVVFWVVLVFTQKLRQWVLPFTCAALIYLGFNVLILARFKKLLSEMPWDPSTAGLGIAVIAFGFALFSEMTLRRIEEKGKAIAVQTGDRIDLPAEPKAEVVIAPKPAEAMAAIDVTGTVTIISSRTQESAQKRVDEDTKKVGYQRGEIYRLPDGSWGVHWGGKYQL